jgi:hypothetical protein
MAEQNQMPSDLSPIDPVLLAWAEYWYSIAWKGLLVAGLLTAVGACAGIMFLLLQWRTSTVLEEQSNWRTSSLEVQAKKADADLARAKADIATAEARAAEAHAGALQAQAELARFKAPRSISEFDKPNVIDALSKFGGTIAAIYIVGEGPEPSSLATSISDVLTQSHWDVLQRNWVGVGAATGLIVMFKPGSGPEIQTPSETLEAALRGAHLNAGILAWEGDWEHFGGMLKSPKPHSCSDQNSDRQQTTIDDLNDARYLQQA